MGMRKTKLFTVAVLCVILAALMCALPTVSANSAQRYWYGTTEMGTTVLGEQVPIAVQSEKIVFDVQQFPDKYYNRDEEEKFEDYSASVTATYQFVNTADYEVTARLAFPYGIKPSYLYGSFSFDDRYGVTVNGEKAETVNRYTYNGGTGSWIEDYENGTAVGQLLDEKKTADGIGVDTRVIKYTYKVGGAEYGSYSAYVEMPKAKGQYLFSMGSFIQETIEKIVYGKSVYNGARIVFWVVCNGEEPEFELYAKGGNRTEETIECTFEQISRTEMTLEEYAESVYALDDDSESAHIDWFNAIVDSIVDNVSVGYSPNPFGDVDNFVSQKIMNWMEYTLVVPAGGTATNSVTAPLFPDIDDGWTPAVYQYGYLLSPAKGWQSFGTLDIEVNTPFKMVGAQENGFEKTETGYKAHFDSLPDGELSFRLSESENPERNRIGYPKLVLFYITVFGTPALGLAELIVIIVFACSWAKRKNAKAAADERSCNTLRAAGTGFVGCIAASCPLILAVVSIIAGAGGFAGSLTVVLLGWLFSIAATVVTVLLCRTPYVGSGADASDEESAPEEESES